jgi:hypothetical protein
MKYRSTNKHKMTSRRKSFQFGRSSFVGCVFEVKIGARVACVCGCGCGMVDRLTTTHAVMIMNVD